MSERLLVANRGEIAARILRTARDLGVESIAVCSSVDRETLHVSLADQVVELEGAPQEVYRDAEAILGAARATGATMVHPGYGFLSENAAFARACVDQGLTFVGPSPQAIALMGDKATARDHVAAHGVPVVPGSGGLVADLEHAVAVAGEIGYPVLIKATAGGGGRGMRVVRNEADLRDALVIAAAEAGRIFSDAGIYLERYLARVRHLEVQLLGDLHGDVVALGERDCSVQRRHQKLLEESPAAGISPAERRELADLAVRVARSASYHSAGTVEFLFDLDSRRPFFIEMNTRIQVEHPVTELVHGIDLVEWQLRVARGETIAPLAERRRAAAAESTPGLHAIECRITAEDPDRDFLPNAGTVTRYRPPRGPWVRVDDFLSEGDRVSPFYDSLIAKVVTWGDSRAVAISRMDRALREFEVEGIRTNLALHLAILRDPSFAEPVTTSYVEERARAASGPGDDVRA